MIFGDLRQQHPAAGLQAERMGGLVPLHCQLRGRPTQPRADREAKCHGGWHSLRGFLAGNFGMHPGEREF